MPFWIEGWVEIARFPETDDEHAWSGVIDLSSLIDTADGNSVRLFGLSKRVVSGDVPANAVAANRGLPSHPSQHVRRAMAETAEHEARFGAGEHGGFTHALWEELRTVELPEPGGDWQLVWELVRQLEKRWSADRIRFVVWFNW